MMPRGQRAYVLATCAAIAGAFAYSAADWGAWPRLTYVPLAGDWTFSPPAGVTQVSYPGLVLWGLGGVICGALVGAVLVRLFPRTWPDRALRLFGAWAITAILLAGSYFTWSAWPW